MAIFQQNIYLVSNLAEKMKILHVFPVLQSKANTNDSLPIWVFWWIRSSCWCPTVQDNGQSAIIKSTLNNVHLRQVSCQTKTLGNTIIFPTQEAIFLYEWGRVWRQPLRQAFEAFEDFLMLLCSSVFVDADDVKLKKRTFPHWADVKWRA